jgi:hypothetical protein
VDGYGIKPTLPNDCGQSSAALLLMYARTETDVVGVLCVTVAIGLHLWRTNSTAGKSI